MLKEKTQNKCITVQGLKSLQTYIETVELSTTEYPREFDHYNCNWPGTECNFVRKSAGDFLPHILLHCLPLTCSEVLKS